jgi:hypothetical protein
MSWHPGDRRLDMMLFPFLLVTATQTRLPAQQVLELGVHAVVTASDPLFGGGGLYGACRVSDRTRIAVTLSGGAVGGDVGMRAEALGHFLLNPKKGHGVGLYALGGAAFVANGSEEGYLVLGIGVEARPGRRSGWALEAGVGGGLRIAAGYRWRRLPKGWVPDK